MSTDPPALSTELIAKLKLEFPILRDEQGTVSRAWGVYDESNSLTKPATFIVARGGKVVFRYTPKNATDIAPTAEVLKAAAELPEP